MYELGSAFGNATVDPGTNILVAGPPLTGKRELAVQGLRQGAEADEGSIVVTTKDDADRMLADFRTLVSGANEVPLGIVDCVTKHQGQSVTDNDRVTYASSPDDMTGIGIKFSEFVEEFYRDRGIQRNRVLFDSLTTLLMYSNLQTVFRFMHVFTSRIENADAIGIHVIDASAHDEETMNTLGQLFDGFVRTDEDRTVDIQLPDLDQSTVET